MVGQGAARRLHCPHSLSRRAIDDRPHVRIQNLFIGYEFQHPFCSITPPTNVDRFAELAVRCLAEAPDTAQVFALDAPVAMPYLRPALTARWTEAGRTVFLADSAGGQAPVLLRYAIEDASVGYARAGRRRVRREVVLGLRYSLVGPGGRLLDEARCRETVTDILHRRDLERVDSDVYDEARAEAPEGGFFQRILEPAALTAAAAGIVYLFFSVRSSGR